MADPAPGTAVLITDAHGHELRPAVVLADTEEGLTVVPVSAEIALATEWDLLLGADLLGYAAMAEVWNYGTVLPEQVREVVARLSSPQHEDLRGLARAARRGEAAPEVAVGPPVLDDEDPRLLFQDAEADAVRALWAPALELAGALSLGELVRHRRSELQLAPEHLP